MMAADLPKRVHQNRPSLILNIDNEYMTYLLMDEIKSKSSVAMIVQTTTSQAASRCLSATTSTGL